MKRMKHFIFIIFIILSLPNCSEPVVYERYIYNIVYRVEIIGVTNNNVNIDYKDADGNTQNLLSQTVPIEIEINKNYSDGIFQPYIQATRNSLPNTESLVVTVILEDYKTSFSRETLNTVTQTNNSVGAANITATLYGTVLPP